VFRHLSQYVEPGAKVVSTSGGDALAFKNADGSIVAVLYSSSGGSQVVSIGTKKISFSMSGGGWATVVVPKS
jgi:glucosylceramidase